MKEIPASSTVIIQKDMKGEDFNNDFHNQCVIGKLDFLENQMYHMLSTNACDFQKTPNNHMEKQFDD